MKFSSAILALLLKVLVVVEADFGDYADLSFSCPATTTCPVICASTIEACPTTCEDPALQVCADGSCAESCDEEVESPCECETASVTCAKVIDLFTACDEKYGPYYQAVEECLAEQEEAAIAANPVSFSDTPYVFVYVWVSVLTVLIIIWCAWNQRMNPSPVVQVVMHKMTTTTAEDQFEPTLYQVGYKHHWLGTIMYCLTVLTFSGWVVVLAFLTIQYYALDGNIYVSKRKVHFSDEEQLLKTFIIAWSVGFSWCFALKWPASIQSLFYRRCSLDQATVVALFQEHRSTAPGGASVSDRRAASVLGYPALHKFLRQAGLAFNAFWSTLFSDVDGFQSRNDGNFAYVPVKRNKNHPGVRFIHFQLRRYNFCSPVEGFCPAVLQESDSLSLAAPYKGLTSDEVQNRFRQIGNNSIDMRQPTFLGCLGAELCKPFYTYQLYMIWSWFPLYYYYMAMVWSGVISTSALIVTWFHYRSLRNLYRLSRIEGSATVIRDGQWKVLDQKELVPGDVVKLEPGLTYCDMLVVDGGTCLVDESALTGESHPQAKVPLDTAISVDIEMLDRSTHKRQIIAAGTSVMEVEENIVIVWKTGSYTTKGELLRDIIGYKRHSFKFDDEITIILVILFFYALFSFNMVVYLIEDTAVYGWFYGIYVVGTILPPLLPTVFTVSVGVSDDRLAQKRIATANSESILIAGKVNRVFFDKTGTLTRQGLDFIRARSVEEWEVDADKSKPVRVSGALRTAMAACHSLTTTASDDMALIGNPVDQTMFKAGNAKFLPNKGGIQMGSGEVLKVIRHFDFDHHRMTQSVVVQQTDGTLLILVKGSGESIQKICHPDSLPADFSAQLQASARDGVYQISVGCRSLGQKSAESVATMSRDEIESDLDFAGVIDFSNVLRPESPDVIRQLAEAGITSTMVTGDSVQTGIRIAQEAGIMDQGLDVQVCSVDSVTGKIQWSTESADESETPVKEKFDRGEIQVAISGKAWKSLLLNDPKEALALAPFIRVFGRCTPHDKVSVIQTFGEYVTCMVGDGGNDTGALRAADVGVALSDAEASMVAPFASLDKDIRSVLDVLKEGRCALASALATYKYMIMYGQVETINQVANAYFQITFSEWCWVFMDGIWTITMAFTLPLAKPADRLSNTRPTASILGLHTLSSAIGVLVINFAFMVIALFFLSNQDWYQCRKWGSNDVSNVLVIGDNYESSVIFLVTGYQYVSSAMAFNFGYEFRQAWWRNYWFLLAAGTFTFLHFYVTLVPGELSCFWRVNCDNENVVNSVTTREKVPIQNPFNTTIMPEHFRVKILFIIIANTIAIMSYEYFVVNGLRLKWARQKRAGATQKGQSEKAVQKELSGSSVENSV